MTMGDNGNDHGHNNCRGDYTMAVTMATTTAVATRPSTTMIKPPAMKRRRKGSDYGSWHEQGRTASTAAEGTAGGRLGARDDDDDR